MINKGNTKQKKDKRHKKSRKNSTRRYKGGVIEYDNRYLGKTSVANVKNILFTQDSVSHSFTPYIDKEGIQHKMDITGMYLYIRDKMMKSGLRTFDRNNLRDIGVPEILYHLQILMSSDGKIYSCDNRRLCLLKRLIRIGFDGDVVCTVTNKCNHPIKESRDVFIQKGNKPGEYCIPEDDVDKRENKKMRT